MKPNKKEPETLLKLGKMATETHEMFIRLYGDAAVSQKMVHKWFERFRGGAESMKMNNAQVIHRLRQQMKTCQKSTK